MLVAELRGEDMKGFRNYIISRSPSVKWRPVRTELSIYKCKHCWSRDSENESYTPWHNRSFSVVNRELNFSYGKFWKRYGYVTIVSRSLWLHYGCAAVVDGHLRRVMEKLKFSNNLKIVSWIKRAYGSTAVYPNSLRSCLRQKYGIVTDINGLKPWASSISNHESVIRALPHYQGQGSWFWYNKEGDINGWP